jgi:hypothetical protein
MFEATARIEAPVADPLSDDPVDQLTPEHPFAG